MFKYQLIVEINKASYSYWHCTEFCLQNSYQWKPTSTSKCVALWSTYLKVGLLHGMLPLKATWSITGQAKPRTCCCCCRRQHMQSTAATQTWRNLPAAKVVVELAEDTETRFAFVVRTPTTTNTPPPSCCSGHDKTQPCRPRSVSLTCQWV